MEKSILEEIYEMIDDREKNPKEKSYTNYLLEEGIDKVCKKVGEEAAEVIIAAKNPNNEEFIGEICDLTYHVLVLMYERNISIKQVEKILTKRHQIEGNKKKRNIRGEY
ncbi:MAG: phosphoribosyl-ATP diphosphatase [Clostridia bacterium]|nr:phosphoribosyl-ATP diphosphatase [Clostridia bacterium]